jgi:alpha,alpha-trehalose phosphorylase
MSYFRMAASIDLHDRMGNASHGIHMATAGGLWQAAVMGFGGFMPNEEGVRIDPRLPGGWRGLTFRVRWRGTAIRVEVRPEAMTVDMDGPATVALGSGALRRLGAGRYRAVLRDKRWLGPEEVPSS